MDKLTLDFMRSRGVISPEIYGHFSEQIGGVFYDGLWVGEDSNIPNIRGFRKALVESFKKIAPPVVRWPGGCFSETYDWRDGIGERGKRPKRVNWWYSCDHRSESNQVGTHEFVDFCRMVGAEPYLAANITSVTPLHIRDWVEYCNFDKADSSLAEERARNGAEAPFNVKYWGLGNENWGGGGNMTPEMYAREYVRLRTIIESLGLKDNKYIVCGPNAYDLEWTRRLMDELTVRGCPSTWGISLHYYTSSKLGASDVYFDEKGWYEGIHAANFMVRMIEDHRHVMDNKDPERKIKLVIDEWGNWHIDGTGPSKGYNLFEQQSNMRDAMTAALTLNIFNNHCDVVGMANVAQLCNNLHSLYLAGGSNFIETPNYHVFAMYKGHQGGRKIETIANARYVEQEGYDPMCTLSASASEKDGKITITLANLDVTAAKRVQLEAIGRELSGMAQTTLLYNKEPNTCNTFENPTAVMPVYGTLEITPDTVVELPAASIMTISL